MMNRNDMELLLNSLIRNAIAFGAANDVQTEASRSLRIDEIKREILNDLYGDLEDQENS